MRLRSMRVRRAKVEKNRFKQTSTSCPREQASIEGMTAATQSGIVRAPR
jgi:hypothetical protein